MKFFRIYIWLLFLLIPFNICWAQEKTPYNVLFIAIDDLNDYVGFLAGHPQVISPNFDRLAAESAIFTNAQCPSPKCAPSRAGLMTGVYPHEEYVPVPLHYRDVPAMEDKVSLAQHFRSNGYKTFSIGKVFHGWGGAKADNPYSWDVHQQLTGNLTGYSNAGPFALSLDNSQLYDDPCLVDNNFEIPPLGPLNIATEDYVETHTAKWVAQQIKTSHEQPFFIGCGFFKPHIPNYAPKEWFDLYQDSIIQNPETLLSDFEDIPPYALRYAFTSQYERYDLCEVTDDIVRAYLANISYVDHCLGIILDALEQSSQKDNTIIVLWSDHGHHQGEKLHFSKNTLWEESARVPLLIKVPRHSQENHRIDSPVNLMDLFPTLLELCQLPDIDVGGRSLVPLMDDIRNEWDYPSITTLDTFNHSIRTRQWRFTRYKDNSLELYNHENDENEWNNLANQSEYLSTTNQLALQMDDILEKGNGLLNEIPRVKWISPSLGNAFHDELRSNFLEIPLEVNAYDIDGNVERVEFWIDDEKISTVSDPPYQDSWFPTESGNHILKSLVVDNEGREIWSRANPIQINFTDAAMHSLGNINFNYYPNPARERFNLFFYNYHSEAILIQLFNSVGVLVEERLTFEATNTFDVSRLTAGIYFLKVSNNKGDKSGHKIIILD